MRHLRDSHGNGNLAPVPRATNPVFRLLGRGPAPPGRAAPTTGAGSLSVVRRASFRAGRRRSRRRLRRVVTYLLAHACRPRFRILQFIPRAAGQGPIRSLDGWGLRNQECGWMTRRRFPQGRFWGASGRQDFYETATMHRVQPGALPCP